MGGTLAALGLSEKKKLVGNVTLSLFAPRLQIQCDQCLRRLLPWFLCGDGLYPRTVSPNTPFLPFVAFVRHFVLTTRRAPLLTSLFFLFRFNLMGTKMNVFVCTDLPSPMGLQSLTLRLRLPETASCTHSFVLDFLVE